MNSPARSSRSASRLAEAATLKRAGRLSEALVVLERARDEDPFDARVLLELARIAGQLALPSAAERCTAAALELEPGNLEILIERTIALRAQGRHDDAITALRTRLNEDPDKAELWLALSNTVHEIGLLAEAETFATECLRLKPTNVQARANLAGLLFDQGDTERALEEFAAAVKRAPNNADIRFNRALALLHAGDLKTGWRDYEWRHDVPGRKIERIFQDPKPKAWRGEPRNGRPLLLLTEQGLGDQLLFLSLVPDLIARDDGPIFLECDPRLVPTIARSFPSVHVHGTEPKAQEGRIRISYDWLKTEGALSAIEIGALPRLLRPARESFPAEHMPLKPDESEAANWQSWLDSLGPGPKIGLCWRSGKRGGLRDIQYAPLEAWARFIAQTRGEPIVTQYDLTNDELKTLSEMSGRTLHVPPKLDQRREIDRLTALLSALDALVSAPTVVSVLAAGVGTPTFKVTHAGSWTTFGGTHEAFLPAARIIRPEQPGDWPEAFRIAAAELAERLAQQ